MQRRLSKYGAVRVEIDGHRFDSKLEAKRYGELKLLQRIGEITGLAVHPKFPIVISGIHVCDVLGDFQYYDTIKRKEVIEDTKGCTTPLSSLKARLVRAAYPGINWNIIKQ